MIDLMNSQAKKPYESKGKKSLMNESSQFIGVNVETLPSSIINKDGQLNQYVQSRTAMDNYRQSTDLNLYQKHSQSLANSNGSLSRHQEYNEGTFCSLKDSLQYVVSDEALLAHQQDVHDLHQSIEKDSTLKRKKYSTDMLKVQTTPLGKQQQMNNQNNRVLRQGSNFNQTILQTGTNLLSPNSNEQSTLAGTVLKNKTQKLNKMLKTLINDTNPTYSQIALVSSPKLQNSHTQSQIQIQPNINSIIGGIQQVQQLGHTNNSKISQRQNNQTAIQQQTSSALSIHAQTTKKETSVQSKTAIQNFKKQSKGMKNGKTINIQSQLKPANPHKSKTISTTIIKRKL